ncbi:MAG: HAD hydrolase family protein [Pseudomonadota bacterium]|nr:HAD hydrolase family protein [Pseudomonadota bacterium]
MASDSALMARARGIRLLTCDVDGVLTDGRIYVGPDGDEYKAFSVLDGVGLKRIAEIGIVVAWISGSKAEAIVHRARSLGIARVELGVEDKLGPWERLRAELALEPAHCAHIGDDLSDVPVLARCGLAATVPHAPSEVQASAHWVTTREGGAGAVREVCDLLLAAQDAPQRLAISGA